jgi:ABC-type uncharacterized transport system permease subunit
MEFFQILASALSGGTILLFGMLGGIFTERSGVMNLAIEGYMLLGATIGYKSRHKPGIHGSVCLPVSWLQPFSVFYMHLSVSR